MPAYYNEHDPYAAQWLRNLIAAGQIADGDVDERSIEDVLPSDLDGYTQCHFFAGIGGWSLALRQAGWADDRPVWSGSAPCQPFSAAGKGAGHADERHLWPAFHHLIKERRPPVVFGEQVEAAIRHGWRDLVQADLEGIDYAYGDSGLPAACIGAPHIRQRLFFVADADGRHAGAKRQQRGGQQRLQPQGGGSVDMADANRAGQRARSKGQPAVGYGQAAESDCCACDLGNATGCGWAKSGLPVARSVSADAGGQNDRHSNASKVDRLAHPEQHDHRCQAESACHEQPEAVGPADQCGGCGGASGRVADNIMQQRPDGKPGICDGDEPDGWLESAAAIAELRGDSRPGPLDGFWRDADWLYCRDGKWRPVEPGTFPLADGIPARMGRGKSTLGGMARSNRVIRLRGYGNAIVPGLAAEFISAYLGGE